MPKQREFKPAQKSRDVLQVLIGQKRAVQVCRELQLRENLLSPGKKFVEQVSRVFEKESALTQDDQASLN